MAGTTTKLRREKGEGSVRFNQKAKKWEARYSYGMRPDGRPDRRSRVAETEAEAKRLLKEMRREADKLREQAVDIKNVTMEEYYMKWLKGKSLQLKPTSFDRLECTVNNQVLPYIGMTQLQNVKTDNLQDIIYDLIEQEYSYSIIKKTYDALNECFRDAMVRGDIVRSPMMGIKLPERTNIQIPQAKEMLPFTDVESQMVIDEAARKYSNDNSVYRLGWLFVFMLCTGVRVGEALALKYSEIDWEQKTVHICRSSQMVINRHDEGRTYETKIFESVKTKSSSRHIPLNSTALEALRNLQQLTGDHEFVAVNKKGGHITYNNFAKTFSGLLKTLQLQQRGLHNLRHTFASQLFAKKVDIKIISKLLGHSSVQITYDTYVHILDEQKQHAIQAIEFDNQADIYTVIDFGGRKNPQVAAM